MIPAATDRARPRGVSDIDALRTAADRFLGRVFRAPCDRAFRLLARWPLRPGEAVLAVRAGPGRWIDSIRLYHPDALLHAFEPDPRRALSVADQFADDPALAVYRCGLGAREETRRLYVPLAGGRPLETCASYDHVQARALTAARRPGLDPKALRMMAVEVKLFALDMLDLPAGLIAVSAAEDVRPLAEGGAKTLADRQPAILAPASDAATRMLCGEMGWRAGRIDRGRLVPGAPSAGLAVYASPARLALLDAGGR